MSFLACSLSADDPARQPTAPSARREKPQAYREVPVSPFGSARAPFRPPFLCGPLLTATT